MAKEDKNTWTKEELIGNKPGGLDEMLLNSEKYTQEERELINQAIYDWIK